MKASDADAKSGVSHKQVQQTTNRQRNKKVKVKLKQTLCTLCLLKSYTANHTMFKNLATECKKSEAIENFRVSATKDSEKIDNKTNVKRHGFCILTFDMIVMCPMCPSSKVQNNVSRAKSKTSPSLGSVVNGYTTQHRCWGQDRSDFHGVSGYYANVSSSFNK